MNRMDDLISRQAAIEIVDRYDKSHMILKGKPMLGAASIVIELEDLPSAQPEIIRCKDCKHWMPYDWMFSEVWQSKNMNDYPEKEIGCAYCDMNMGANDFCSRAERREDAND